MNWFFTADEHYGHQKIIQYCNRPFNSLEEMNQTMIAQHNQIVGKGDTTVHVGDFCWAKKQEEAHREYISHLNGNHIFVRGSHDHWLPDSAKSRWRRMIEGQFVVVDHYAGRTWERAHYGAWQLYGHSHGRLVPDGLQMDVGVDCNNFAPVSFEAVAEFMQNRNSTRGVMTWRKLIQITASNLRELLKGQRHRG
jgi:calcineurin-like phosphoesterase family protein